jgi:hypothetical protein
MNRLIKLLMSIWSFLMMIAMLFLVREYWYLAEQSHKLMALKNEYENHLMAVSRILYEYTTLRDNPERVAEISGKKKTKHIAIPN